MSDRLNLQIDPNLDVYFGVKIKEALQSVQAGLPKVGEILGERLSLFSDDQVFAYLSWHNDLNMLLKSAGISFKVSLLLSDFLKKFSHNDVNVFSVRAALTKEDIQNFWAILNGMVTSEEQLTISASEEHREYKFIRTADYQTASGLQFQIALGWHDDAIYKGLQLLVVPVGEAEKY
jgi:hypothetical protein